VNSRDGPAARKKKTKPHNFLSHPSKLSGLVSYELDDVIEETPINVITNEATPDITAGAVSGTIVPIKAGDVNHTFCTSGDPYFNHAIDIPWIPTGLYPQVCSVVLKLSLKVVKVTVECIGARRLSLRVTNHGQVTTFNSPVLPPSAATNVSLRHTAVPEVDIFDTPRRNNDYDSSDNERMARGSMGSVGHNTLPGSIVSGTGVIKQTDFATNWTSQVFNLSRNAGERASEEKLTAGYLAKEIAVVVDEAHEASKFVVLRNFRIFTVEHQRSAIKGKKESKIRGAGESKSDREARGSVGRGGGGGAKRDDDHRRNIGVSGGGGGGSLASRMASAKTPTKS
jgi:hypothetical protein